MDRFWKKLQGWKEKMLLRVERDPAEICDSGNYNISNGCL